MISVLLKLLFPLAESICKLADSCLGLIQLLLCFRGSQEVPCSEADRNKQHNYSAAAALVQRQPEDTLLKSRHEKQQHRKYIYTQTCICCYLAWQKTGGNVKQGENVSLSSLNNEKPITPLMALGEKQATALDCTTCYKAPPTTQKRISSPKARVRSSAQARI
jgi:hypothetical protein